MKSILLLLFIIIIISSVPVATSSQEFDMIQERDAQELASVMTRSGFCSSSKYPCGFHGDCFNGVCKCHMTPELGYWTGAVCDDCLPGFAGPNCKIACQGGAWTPCSGHGICSSGVKGDGACTCFDDQFFGYWSGTACDKCKAFYYPEGFCNFTCPGVAEGAAPCYARGTCSIESPGTCSCEPGWSSSLGCKDCNASSYGAECALRCTGFVLDSGKPCSGHGLCYSGVHGDGTCTCDKFYGQRDCSKKCPNECSGHGYCSDGVTGTAECTCMGNFAPPDCAKCRTNVTGVNCTVKCPTDSNGVMCSGRGSCVVDTWSNPNATTETAVCLCDLGYTGGACQIACPGSPPCSGHGACTIDSVPGAQPICSCFTNSSHGFWTGTSCDRCQVEYNNSATCTSRCPTDNSDVVCSGHGWCAEGKCYCDRLSDTDFCGAACNISSIPAPQSPGGGCNLCSCELCVVPGTFGPDCGSICPGNLRCSGHGHCDQGLNGTGICECEDGWTGEACNLACPKSGSLPCGGIARGKCITVNRTLPLEGIVYSAACECLDGYAGAACDQSCPWFDGHVCSNHGTCNSTSAQCRCEPGWTGAACNINCGCNSDFGLCDSARCDQIVGKSAATCYECLCKGNFTGLCSNCKNGTQGEFCQFPCENGKTVGRSCECDPYWSSSSCSVRCPTDSTTGQICSGHGTCDWGAEKTGVCTCSEFWYGPTCNVSCSVGYCQQNFGLKNPQCNDETGECECLDDGLALFQGPKCENCGDFTWGPLCSEPCACSGHGTCQDTTGECNCFASELQGYYSGSACTKCAAGYIGDNCERRNIAFTPLIRTTTVSTPRNLSARISFLWPDTDSSNILIGGGTSVIGVSSVAGGNAQEFGSVSNASSVNSACSYLASKAEVAVSWIDKGTVYAFLQPCGDALLRLYKIPQAALDLPTSSATTAQWVPHGTWDVQLINSTVVISHAKVKVVGSGKDAGFVAFLIIAQPLSKSSSPPYEYYPGGTIYRIHIDTIISNAAISAHTFTDLRSNFIPTDLDAMYSDFLFQEAVVIGGQSIGVGWDLMLYSKSQVTNQLEPFFSAGVGEATASIRFKMRCFPKAVVTTDYCQECSEIARVRFTDKFSIVAAINQFGSEAIVAWFERDITLAANQLVLAAETDILPCELAIYDAGLQQLRSVATGQNFLPPSFVIEVSRSLVPNSRVTAMTVDEPGYTVYLGVLEQDPENEVPGVLTKYALIHGNFSILGTLTLGFAVAEGNAVAEVAEYLAVNTNQRVLYALIADTRVVRVLSFLAYETQSFVPDLADIRGGTNVTVHGLGFFKQPGFEPMCSFAGADPVKAIILDSRTMYCLAPALLNNSASSCSGQPIEVSLFGTTWMTQNAFTIQRVQPAKIIGSTLPDRGSLKGQKNISITGTGFQPSNYAKCKFYSNNSLATEVLYSPLKYVSSTQASCDQPQAQFASFDTSFIDVSLDGQLYSEGLPAQYQIVGAATNISSPDTFSIIAVGSPDPQGNYTSIRSFNISATIVDEQLHRLESLDTLTRTVCMSTDGYAPCSLTEFSWRVEGDEYPPSPCRNNTFEIQGAIPSFPECVVMTEGRAVFNINVPDARSGVFTLEFYTRVGSERWFSETLLTIQEGEAYALAISNKKAMEARPFIIEGSALSPGPEIAVVDRLGNLLPKLDRLDQNFVVTAQAYYILDSDPGVKINTNRYSLPRQDAGKIRFGQIVITRYIHGANHYVNFTSVNPSLVSAVTPPLRTEPCPDGNSSFKLPNSSSCLPCPTEGAICDGSELIIVLPGYWNGTTIGNIFKCPGGKTVCLGSTYGGSPCAEGYEGPLCALCTRSDKNGKMWGKAGTSSCAECPDPTLGAVYLSLGGIGVIVALFIWSFVILRQPEVTPLSVILRTVVNHLQAAGNLGDFSSEMSPLVRSFLQVQDAASSPSFSGLSSLDCLIRRSGADYASLFYGYMMLPVLSFFMAIAMYVFVKITKKAPVITDKLREDIEEDIRNMPTAPSAIFLREYPFYVVAITTLSVNMFTIYQTLIAQSTAVLRCTELVIMPENSTVPVKQQYLDVDMTITCNENGDHKLRTAAYLFAICYGFGVPSVFCLGYKFFQRRVGNIEIMKLMFMFLTGGYKDQFWFWQALIMIRKMFLVVVVVFMAETGDLQAYAGMWVMAGALLLQLYFSPNEAHDHNQVEAISLAVIVATLNLGFLYPSLNSTGKILLTVTLMIITIGMLIVFAYFLFEPLRQQILEIRDDVMAAVEEITNQIGKKDDEDGRKLRFDEDETQFELEEVIPQLNRVRNKDGGQTAVLDQRAKERIGTFEELEEIDLWDEKELQKQIQKKRDEKNSKFDDML